ncbi:hypothetical protein FQZ97_705630 [compost metagenome]
MEGPQALRAAEGPFREEHQGLALAQRLGQGLTVRDAALQVEALDEARAELAQEQAGEPLAGQLALGDEGEPRR